MKGYAWNEKKNEWLKAERNVSFEQVMEIIERKETLDVIDNPNQRHYPN